MQFAKYDLFLSQQVAHFLQSLTRYQDRNGSVLDNTIVLFGSGASTTHNPQNLPTLIAGGANMGLKHGTYWRKGRDADVERLPQHSAISRSRAGIVCRQHWHAQRFDFQSHLGTAALASRSRAWGSEGIGLDP